MADAILGILSLVFVSSFRKETRFGLKKTIDTLEAGTTNALQASIASAAVGIIIGRVHLTSLSVNPSDSLIVLSRGYLAILLVVTMIACIILGLGMIPTIIYITLAVLVAPAL
jgi:TRAP-type uncharacterized transport system fused permease subunit